MKTREEVAKETGKFEYVVLLAWEFPWEEIDEDGYSYAYPHYTCFYNDKEAGYALERTGLKGKEELFYNQKDIIPVIEAYGLDKEKFWYAVVYIANLTVIWSRQKSIHKLLPPEYDQIKSLRDEIIKCNPEKCPKGKSLKETKSCPISVNCTHFCSCHEFKVVFDSPTESHSVPIAGNGLMRNLVTVLNEWLKKIEASEERYAQELPIWREETQARKTEMTWYAAHLFWLLFDILNLPILRSRGIKKIFKRLQGADVLIRGHDAEISYDKKQLIANLIQFLGFSEKNYLDKGDINSHLRSKRPFGLGIF